MIATASPGRALQASVRFLDIDDFPVAPDDTVYYKVFDPANRLVLSGAGIVDTVDASLFTATITLPDSAPPTADTGGKYSIKWSTVAGGAALVEREYFEVVAVGGDPDSFYAKDIVVIPGSGFSDYIKIKHTSSPPTCSFTMIDESGRIISTKTPSYSVKGNIGEFKVSYTAEEVSQIPYPTGVQQHYVGNWRMFSGDLETDEVESRPIYFLTPQAQTLVHAMHKMLDEGVLRNVEPYLTWNTGVFLHHICKGFNVINALPPRVTSFSIYSPLPVGLVDLIEKAGMVSALNAQLFAVQSNWDFQGAGVQLNVDRVSGLSDLISRLQADIDKGADAKKTWMNSGQPVAISNAAKYSRMPISANEITIHAGTNLAIPVNYEAVGAPSVLFCNGAPVRGGSYRKL